MNVKRNKVKQQTKNSRLNQANQFPNHETRKLCKVCIYYKNVHTYVYTYARIYVSMYVVCAEHK